jgi:hypothetical protein
VLTSAAQYFLEFHQVSHSRLTCQHPLHVKKEGKLAGTAFMRPNLGDADPTIPPPYANISPAISPTYNIQRTTHQTGDTHEAHPSHHPRSPKKPKKKKKMPKKNAKKSLHRSPPPAKRAIINCSITSSKTQPYLCLSRSLVPGTMGGCGAISVWVLIGTTCKTCLGAREVSLIRVSGDPA